MSQVFTFSDGILQVCFVGPLNNFHPTTLVWCTWSCGPTKDSVSCSDSGDGARKEERLAVKRRPTTWPPSYKRFGGPVAAPRRWRNISGRSQDHRKDLGRDENCIPRGKDDWQDGHHVTQDAGRVVFKSLWPWKLVVAVERCDDQHERVLSQVPASHWLCGSSKEKKDTAADVVWVHLWFGWWYDVIPISHNCWASKHCIIPSSLYKKNARSCRKDLNVKVGSLVAL